MERWQRRKKNRKHGNQGNQLVRRFLAFPSIPSLYHTNRNPNATMKTSTYDPRLLRIFAKLARFEVFIIRAW